jgi:hypothetical protein
MKYISYFIQNPLLVIFAAIIGFFVAPYGTALGVSITLFFVSLITIIYNRKWLKSFLSLLGYGIFMILMVGLYLFAIGGGEPSFEIADNVYYSDRIEEITGLKIPATMMVLSKIDTIYFRGIEGEFDEEIVLEGDRLAISSFVNKLSKDPSFQIANSLKNYPTKVLSNSRLHENDLEIIFNKEIQGEVIYQFAFDKLKSRMYFVGFHY